MGRRGRPGECREDWFCRRVIGKGLLVVVSFVRACGSISRALPLWAKPSQPVTLTVSCEQFTTVQAGTPLATGRQVEIDAEIAYRRKREDATDRRDRMVNYEALGQGGERSKGGKE